MLSLLQFIDLLVVVGVVIVVLVVLSIYYRFRYLFVCPPLSLPLA